MNKHLASRVAFAPHQALSPNATGKCVELAVFAVVSPASDETRSSFLIAHGSHCGEATSSEPFHQWAIIVTHVLEHCSAFDCVSREFWGAGLRQACWPWQARIGGESASRSRSSGSGTGGGDHGGAIAEGEGSGGVGWSWGWGACQADGAGEALQALPVVDEQACRDHLCGLLQVVAEAHLPARVLAHA